MLRIKIKGKDLIVKTILGPGYDLSLAAVSDPVAARLNFKYRGRKGSANVLSFPLSPAAGEIILNLAQIRREAGRWGRTPAEHTARLFIHGVLHLKGWRHGSTMNAEENKLFERFFNYAQNHRHRPRHRDFQPPAGRRRTGPRQPGAPRPRPN